MKLVIFDVDGTLVDSQAPIYSAMEHAFLAEGLGPPTRAATRAIVGLSVPQAIAALAPDQDAAMVARLSDAFKARFGDMRHDPGFSLPLYPGARQALDALSSTDDLLIAVATGNSRRGLDHVIELHGFNGLFSSLQTADDHPSKPHPSMVEACMAEAGVSGDDTVMVGDTIYDMGMAQAAKTTGLGVDWGYHPPAELRKAGATHVLAGFDALVPWLDQHWEQT